MKPKFHYDGWDLEPIIVAFFGALLGLMMAGIVVIVGWMIGEWR